MPASIYYVDDAPYSCSGDGVTNDRGKIQSALNDAAAAGGGVVMLGPKRYRIPSGALIVPENVELTGPVNPGGQRTDADYRTVPGSLVFDASATCYLRTSKNTALRNLCVMTAAVFAGPATTVREGVNLRASMNNGSWGVKVGNGTLNNGSDCTLEYLLILGFEWGIYCDENARLHVNEVKGDNKNGLYMGKSYDVAMIKNVHWWPFLTGNLSNVTKVEQTITNVAAAGSLLRVTTSAVHGFINGDTVNVYGVGGTVSANARWAVTVINTTQFDLNGSVAAGAPAYTGGGKALIWNNRRTGTGFYFSESDGPRLIDCFCFGYDKGFDLTGSSHGVTNASFVSCGVDDLLDLNDPFTVGITFRGMTSRNSFISGSLSSQGTSVYSDCGTGLPGHNNGDNRLVAMQVPGGFATYDVNVVNGALVLLACDLPLATVALQTTGDALAAVVCDARSATFYDPLGVMRLIGNR